MLKSHADYLITEHPHLSSQIQTGLLLAIAGRVKPIGDPDLALIRQWEVLGETYTYTDGKSLCKTYTVRDLDTAPRRWSCNCEQGQTYGPLTADPSTSSGHGFLGYPGRICKHIAAVAICWLECAFMEKPASLWELVTRRVSEQAVYLAAGESIELPTPHKVKLEYYDKNGQSGLCLKTGKARSGVLARWLPNLSMYGGGEWRLVGEAEGKYKEFVSKLKGAM